MVLLIDRLQLEHGSRGCTTHPLVRSSPFHPFLGRPGEGGLPRRAGRLKKRNRNLNLDRTKHPFPRPAHWLPLVPPPLPPSLPPHRFTYLVPLHIVQQYRPCSDSDRMKAKAESRKLFPLQTTSQGWQGWQDRREREPCVHERVFGFFLLGEGGGVWWALDLRRRRSRKKSLKKEGGALVLRCEVMTYFRRVKAQRGARNFSFFIFFSFIFLSLVFLWEGEGGTEFDDRTHQKKIFFPGFQTPGLVFSMLQCRGGVRVISRSFLPKNPLFQSLLPPSGFFNKYTVINPPPPPNTRWILSFPRFFFIFNLFLYLYIHFHFPSFPAPPPPRSLVFLHDSRSGT